MLIITLVTTCQSLNWPRVTLEGFTLLRWKLILLKPLFKYLNLISMHNLSIIYDRNLFWILFVVSQLFHHPGLPIIFFFKFVNKFHVRLIFVHSLLGMAYHEFSYIFNSCLSCFFPWHCILVCLLQSINELLWKLLWVFLKYQSILFLIIDSFQQTWDYAWRFYIDFKCLVFIRSKSHLLLFFLCSLFPSTVFVFPKLA